MTRVSFYILEAQDQDPTRFLCRLIARIHRTGKPIYVHCANEVSRSRLDSDLWTFEQGSFLPHECYEGGDGDAAPILLGCDTPPEEPREVLINQADAVPDFFSSFERCVELVAGSDEQRAAARERFRFYRDRGYDLESHKI